MIYFFDKTKIVTLKDTFSGDPGPDLGQGVIEVAPGADLVTGNPVGSLDQDQGRSQQKDVVQV